eukprot:366499-Chlamydomonas_euryale.AAC.10
MTPRRSSVHSLFWPARRLCPTWSCTARDSRTSIPYLSRICLRVPFAKKHGAKRLQKKYSKQCCRGTGWGKTRGIHEVHADSHGPCGFMRSMRILMVHADS